MQININNKIKQAVNSFWGSDKFTKKHTEIPDSMFKDKPIGTPKRKKKKRKKYVSPYSICPFCKEALVELPKEGSFRWIFNYEDHCRHCGSYEMTNCPACHRNTWYDPKNNIYKHKRNGCGFEGKLLKREENNDS